MFQAETLDHVAFPVRDLPRSEKFYLETVGLTFMTQRKNADGSPRLGSRKGCSVNRHFLIRQFSYDSPWKNLLHECNAFNKMSHAPCAVFLGRMRGHPPQDKNGQCST